MYSAMTTPSMNNQQSINLTNDLIDIRQIVAWQWARQCYLENLPLDEPTWTLVAQEIEDEHYQALCSEALEEDYQLTLLEEQRTIARRQCDCGRDCEDCLTTCWVCHFM